MTQKTARKTAPAPTENTLPPLPEGWEWVTMGEIAKINYREPFIKELPDNLEVTFLPMSAVDAVKGAIAKPKVKLLNKVRRGYTSFVEGDVLFAKITPSMENGKAAIAKGLTNGIGFGSTEFHVLRPEDNVIPEWLFYFIRQEDFRKDAKANFAGTAGQLRVPARFLQNYPIPLAPRQEQERIVAKIEALFSHLEAAQTMLARTQRNLTRYRASVLKAAVEGRLVPGDGDPHRRGGFETRPNTDTRPYTDTPDAQGESGEQLLRRILAERRARWEAQEWEKLVAKAKQKAAQARRKAQGQPARLSDIPEDEWQAIPEAEYQRHLPKNDKWKAKYKEPAPPDTANLPPLPQNWAWATVEQITTSIQYGYTESAKREPVGPKFLRITDIQNDTVVWDEVPFCECPDEIKPKYLLEDGDLVFARTGATTGKNFLVRNPPDAVFASYLIRLRTDKLMLPDFVYIFFNSPFYWSQISFSSKGSAQPGVNATILASLPIPLPPLAEQERIVAEVERRLAAARRLEETVTANLRRLARLRQAILKAAFAGELVAPDGGAGFVGAGLKPAPTHDDTYPNVGAGHVGAGLRPAPTADDTTTTEI